MPANFEKQDTAKNFNSEADHARTRSNIFYLFAIWNFSLEILRDLGRKPFNTVNSLASSRKITYEIRLELVPVDIRVAVNENQLMFCGSLGSENNRCTRHWTRLFSIFFVDERSNPLHKNWRLNNHQEKIFVWNFSLTNFWPFNADAYARFYESIECS